MSKDEVYMRRAIQLAGCGEGRTLTNPLVGAVIVSPEDRIIGEGYHRHYGGPHAEVNALRSVRPKDHHLLGQSTIYVTLEPCSHYGKTPPCAELLIREGLPRIVIGATDPFPKVAGRGIEMLREAGRDVITAVLEKECRDLNRRFIFAHENKRPYVQLKWAQSADGFIAGTGGKRLLLSNPLSMISMHHQRAIADAIMVGANTIITDNPRLDCRFWPGKRPLALTRQSRHIPENSNFVTTPHVLRQNGESLTDFLHRIYRENNVLSLMVEGGRIVLQEFINSNLFEEIRIEINSEIIGRGVKAPDFNPSDLIIKDNLTIRGNKLWIFQR